MLLPRLSALLPLLAAAEAFKNTAPFLMLATYDISGIMRAAEVARHGAIEAAIARAYNEKSCKDGRHVLISQPGLTSADIQEMPGLVTLAKWSKLPSRFEVPHVLDAVDDSVVQKHMVDVCGPATIVDANSWSWSKPNTKSAKVVIYRGKALPEDAIFRSQALKELDHTLEGIVKHFPSTGAYTVVLVSSPRDTTFNDGVAYTMDETLDESLHQELKRDLWERVSNSSSNKTGGWHQGDLPLFEKYQYLNPALFMGLSVSVLLLLILYVGISAIAGLEVSYKAFDKEMAPQNQKKQQ